MRNPDRYPPNKPDCSTGMHGSRSRSFSPGITLNSEHEPFSIRDTRATSEPPCFASFVHDSEEDGCATAKDTKLTARTCTGENRSPASHSISSRSKDLFGAQLSSFPSSLSHRRMASGTLPVLDSYVSLPSTTFDTVSLLSNSGPLGTTALCYSLSDLSLRDGSAIPRTPACQVIRTPHSPPEAPRQVNAKTQRKPSTSVPTSFQQQIHTPYPFTPLEAGMSPSALPPNIKHDPLSGLGTFLSQEHGLRQPITPPLSQHPLPIASSTSATFNRPHAAGHLIWRRVFLTSTRSPPHTASEAPSPRPIPRTHEADGLASPLILDSTFQPIESPQMVQKPPLQCSIRSAESQDYFQMHAYADETG